MVGMRMRVDNQRATETFEVDHFPVFFDTFDHRVDEGDFIRFIIADQICFTRAFIELLNG